MPCLKKGLRLSSEGFLKRFQSTSIEAVNRTRCWSEVPQPPYYPIIGNTYLYLKKENMTSIDRMHRGLREKYGDTYKIDAFGDTNLFIHNPKDAQTLINNDGSLPIIPGFNQLAEFRRTEFPEYFSETTGLISEGEEWAKFRQLVQQDMMRSSTALLYIEE